VIVDIVLIIKYTLFFHKSVKLNLKISSRGKVKYTNAVYLKNIYAPMPLLKHIHYRKKAIKSLKIKQKKKRITCDKKME